MQVQVDELLDGDRACPIEARRLPDADGAEPRMGAAMRAASAVSFDADLRSIAPCSVSDVAQISPRDISVT